MNPNTTAVILVGYQNDYFDRDGLLHQVFEESSTIHNVITNTVKFIKQLPTSTLVIATPIHFTPTYEELIDPVGILKNIKDAGALQAGNKGSQMTTELLPFASQILEIQGKRGFNAFAYTDLHQVLQANQIKDIAIAGAITSICIDSTGRAAQELGYQVSILSDCTAARTVFEQEFYCENIFPIYSNVITHQKMLDSFKVMQ
ncbi:MAG: cysteine hydrolase family protein [Cyanobacteria bacterium P01_F01_bin.143]